MDEAAAIHELEHLRDYIRMLMYLFAYATVIVASAMLWCYVRNNWGRFVAYMKAPSRF